MNNQEESQVAQRGSLEELDFRFIGRGKRGFPRGSCESCALPIWSQGGFRVPGLNGIYCSLLCVECEIAQRTGNTKKIADHKIGDGFRLQNYLREKFPELLFDRHGCLQCGVILGGRKDKLFCSDTHKKRYFRRRPPKAPKQAQNGEINGT